MLLKIKTKTRARKAIKSKIQPFKNNNNKINVKLQPKAYPMLSLVVVRISVFYLKKFFNKNVAKTIENDVTCKLESIKRTVYPTDVAVKSQVY